MVTTAPTTSRRPSDPADLLRADVDLMVRFAAEHGVTMPEGVAHKLAEAGATPAGDLAVLTTLHAELSRVIAPVTPRSIRGAEEGRWLVVRMGWAAVALAFGVVALRVTPEKLPDDGDWAELAWTLYDHLIAISAALLGAMFYNLYKANQYLTTTTYDPVYTTTYWNRLVVGVLAGMVLEVVITGTQGEGGADDGAASFSRPLLGLLAGYSAEAVSQSLDRLVEALRTVVAGRGEDASRAELAARQARLDADARRRRLRYAAELVTLERDLAAPLDEASREKLRGVIDGLSGP